jgi:hypothetical protein
MVSPRILREIISFAMKLEETLKKPITCYCKDRRSPVKSHFGRGPRTNFR